MIKVRFRMSGILLLLICLIALFFIALSVNAEKGGSKKDTSGTGAMHQTQYGISPWGGTWMTEQFRSDIGIGQQGVRYQYTEPLTASFTSSSRTGLGMGLGRLFAGYGGWDSPTASISYGPNAYGNTPQVMPTSGWSSRGAASGSIFGNNTNSYMAQPLTMFGFMGGLPGGFGGFSRSINMLGYPVNSYGLGGWAYAYGWW